MTDLERQDLQQQVEQGRRAQVAQDFLCDFLLKERAQTIYALENLPLYDLTNMQALVAYLQSLSSFERSAKTFIDIGEIAERELNKDGNE